MQRLARGNTYSALLYTLVINCCSLYFTVNVVQFIYLAYQNLHHITKPKERRKYGFKNKANIKVQLGFRVEPALVILCVDLSQFSCLHAKTKPQDGFAYSKALTWKDTVL